MAGADADPVPLPARDLSRLDERALRSRTLVLVRRRRRGGQRGSGRGLFAVRRPIGAAAHAPRRTCRGPDTVSRPRPAATCRWETAGAIHGDAALHPRPAGVRRVSRGCLPRRHRRSCADARHVRRRRPCGPRSARPVYGDLLRPAICSCWHSCIRCRSGSRASGSSSIARRPAIGCRHPSCTRRGPSWRFRARLAVLRSRRFSSCAAARRSISSISSSDLLLNPVQVRSTGGQESLSTLLNS
jgi:hypothetical protein